ncbi:MAG TPA: MerR family transcriptional regulator [Candidatus Sulfotelmatobacter sp.]|nr:MerR family transcriptional regulator [Candidatus Sulfotelmatobacter sp.]
MALVLIGKVARQAGVSPATVRLYESKGLVRPAARSASGYRRFPQGTVERLHLIQCALAIGFTIEELARILRHRDAGGTPCREVQTLARVKLAELTRRRNELDRRCRLLKSTLASWSAALSRTPRGKPAGLLDSLAARAGWLAGMKSPLLCPNLGKRKERNI